MKTRIVFFCNMLLCCIQLYAVSPSFLPEHEVVVCGPNAVYFVCTNPIPPQHITWYYGDGTIGYGLSSSHQYDSVGVYDVKMIVETNGKVDSVIKTAFVTINPKPLAKLAISYTDDLSPLKRKVTFTGSSNDTSEGALMWYINGVFISSDSQFNHHFVEEGMYEVKLVVSNTSGCISECADTVIISEDVLIPTSSTEISNAQKLIVSLSADYSQLYINHLIPFEKGIDIIIYDITGKKIQQGYYTHFPLVIPLQAIGSGMFIVELNTGLEKVVKKIRIPIM